MIPFVVTIDLYLFTMCGCLFRNAVTLLNVIVPVDETAKILKLM